MFVAAVDLGASSGRVMRAEVGADRLALTEAHRFRNRAVRVRGTLHWDILALYQGVLDGLRALGEAPASVGIDSWAVDYGLLDTTGALLGNPVHYRDTRTDHAPERITGRIPAGELYARTGIRLMPINTNAQLMADGNRTNAVRLLMIPDLISYWLTGVEGTELTNASTTGLLDIRTGDWANDLLARLDLRPDLFTDLREPGTSAGELTSEVLAETGLPGPVPVTTVCAHDTASAVLAVPASSERFGYISCGTWSLVGVELTEPVLTEAARTADFTNELGVDGTVRFLRNVTGLWLLQESLRHWPGAHLPTLLATAATLPPLTSVIDVNADLFGAPGDMPARIAAECRRTGQPVPGAPAEFVRCIVDSLALAHRSALHQAQDLAGLDLDTVHIVGGGARNELLCQRTADACGRPVIAGPVEATALGNALVQARAIGAVDGDRARLRALVRDTQRLRRYEPATGQAPWAAAAERLSR